MQYVNQLGEVIGSLATGFNFKLLFSALMTIYSFFFSFDFKLAMTALVMLLIFDLLTGLVAAYVSKEAIESRRMFKTALKFGVYGTLVSSAHLTDVITGFHLNLEFSMLCFLALTELVSIIENAGKMGFAVPQKILNQIQSFRSTKAPD